MMKPILFTPIEIEIITRVISVPLGAFGLNELIEKTGLEKKECERLNNIFKENRRNSGATELAISSEDLVKIAQVFAVSAKIIDPIDMHTLVGYSWDEAMSVLKKLNSLSQI